MPNLSVTRFFTDTRLKHFLPLPLDVVTMGLPSTAVLLYARLLYRGFSSRKNGYTDEAGWVYVVYPNEALARDMGLQSKMVQKHMKALEEAGLIFRKRPVGNRANHIYLNIPSTSEDTPPSGPFVPPGTSRNALSAPREVPTSNTDKRNNKNIFYYQYEEEESL